MAHNNEISRLVFNFPGFEGNSLERQLDRFHAQVASAGELWGFEAERGEVSHQYGGDSDQNFAVVDYSCQGGNWTTKTRLVQFRWEDIIASYEKDRFPRLWFVNMPKYLAFFFNGTVFRYFAASVRYGIFTIFPLVLMAVFFTVSWVLADFALSWFVATAPLLFLLKFLISLGLTVTLCSWPGNWAYVNLTIADWGFALDMCKRSNPDVENRYEQFAQGVIENLKESDAREVIFVGHSFGSVWATAALAKVLEKEPEIFSGREVTFFALGSSLLKIALVPTASHYREFAGRILTQADFLWHEIQTRIDIIAFYKSDPVAAMGLYDSAREAPAKVVIDKVAYKKFMDKARYKKMRKSYYRTHRQYILHLDKRCPQDMFLKLMGPFSSRQLALDPEICKQIDQNGRLHGQQDKEPEKE